MPTESASGVRIRNCQWRNKLIKLTKNTKKENKAQKKLKTLQLCAFNQQTHFIQRFSPLLRFHRIVERLSATAATL